MNKTMIDPPEGWRYGFPKVFDWNSEQESFSSWMVNNGYPEKNLELAEKYSRYWNIGE